MKRNYTPAEIAKAVEESKGNKKERGMVLLTDIKELIETLSTAMSDRLKKSGTSGDDDDDF